MSFLLILIFTFFAILSNGCGGSSTQNVSGEDQLNETQEYNNSINTEKLIGTPLEGLTRGNDFPEDYLLCDEYRTDTIDSFPIPIFTAFLDNYDNDRIKEGITFVNEIIGFEAYQYTDIWSDEVRLFYGIDDDSRPLGEAFSIYVTFNGTFASEAQAVDWTVALRLDTVTKYIVAHELAHATGIRYHQLIDYENDTYVPAEENSLMVTVQSDAVLTDYSYMMQKQGEIMKNHLNEDGSPVDFGFNPCVD